MRRSFAFVVFPLALVGLVPVLLLARVGSHEHPAPPWGIDAARLHRLQRDREALGLRPGSVFVAEAGAGRIDEAPILLEGRTRGGRTCAFVVHGSTTSRLHCLDDVLRAKPLWALTYHAEGMPGLGVLGILRADVERIAAVDSRGRVSGSVILEPGHVFNLGVPGSSLHLRLYSRGRRAFDVRLHG